jgi:hypothetical protein
MVINKIYLIIACCVVYFLACGSVTTIFAQEEKSDDKTYELLKASNEKMDILISIIQKQSTAANLPVTQISNNEEFQALELLVRNTIMPKIDGLANFSKDKSTKTETSLGNLNNKLIEISKRLEIVEKFSNEFTINLEFMKSFKIEVLKNATSARSIEKQVNEDLALMNDTISSLLKINKDNQNAIKTFRSFNRDIQWIIDEIDNLYMEIEDQQDFAFQEQQKARNIPNEK